MEQENQIDDGEAIESFCGQWRWLSNFWSCPVVLDGVTYASVEHAYQAAKTTADARAVFRRCTAGQAKRLGRQVQVRADWEQVKVEVMRGLLEQKFAEGSTLGKLLADTGGRRLVEGNQWGDRFWGVCRGHGENRLGRLLEDRREFLQKQAARPGNGTQRQTRFIPW